jgi:transcriptional regulator with XRE-family HTH domain
MTQAELAKATGMSQNNISRLENPDYGKHTSSSLKRIAEALDVAVIVRLIPFSQYVNWLSGEPHLDFGLRPEALAVPEFKEEEEDKCFDTNFKYWQVISASGSIAESNPDTQGAYLDQFVTSYEMPLGKAS